MKLSYFHGHSGAGSPNIIQIKKIERPVSLCLLIPACVLRSVLNSKSRKRTRTNTNPNGTKANAAGRSGNARALRKQRKCGMIQEGEGHWPNSTKNLQKKARNLWVLRTPQNNKQEGARAKKLVTCGTRGPLGRGQSVPFSAQGAYCSAPEP